MRGMSRQRNVAGFVLAASIVTFGMGSVGLSLKLEPFATWYYLFAWWPYILGAEAALCLMGGYSSLFEEPRRFLIMLPLSVTLWLVFELYNFRLDNWQYLNLPANPWVRWAGYALSFATVLPGLSVTRRLLEFWGVFDRAACKPWPKVRRLYGWCTHLGLACLVLPVLFPRTCFPLVWAGPALLLEPVLHARGARSFLGGLALGRPRLLWQTLLAGGVCGLLWECWNYWARAKWVYSVPFVGDVKLFEMPVAGFLGFPVFALSCFAMSEAFFLLLVHLRRFPAPRQRLAWLMCGVAGASFGTAVLLGMDLWTVASFTR